MILGGSFHTRRLRGAAVLATLLAGVAALAGCGSGGGGGEGGRVVATTTVLADLVRQVGGERVSVASLVPAGGEVHTFDPRPSDIVALGEADLVVMNGLGLDDWATGLAGEAGSDAPVTVLAEDLAGVEYLRGDDEDEHHEDEHDEGVNPHLWLDAAYARLYVERIAGALAEVDPDGAADYRERAQAYAAELEELDGWIGEQLASVPDRHRRVVSVHAAFDYYAEAYGLEVAGIVIDAPGQEPSAGEVAELVDRIRSLEVSAILAEEQLPTRVADAIAAETGVVVIGGLYTDSLGEGVSGYVDLMRGNTERIVASLTTMTR